MTSAARLFPARGHGLCNGEDGQQNENERQARQTSWLSIAVRNPPIFPVFSTFCDAAKLPPKVSGKSPL